MAEISALDLHYILAELKALEGARVDKIVQPSKEEAVFQFFVSGKGKKILRIALPGFLYIAEERPETPEKLFGFCSALRKYLSNGKLEKIEQVGSERIAKLSFKSKEGQYFLFVEMFSKGNMILCRKDLSIIVPAVAYKTKEREVKAGVKYVIPKKDVDFFKITLSDVKNILKKQKQPASKALAVGFGFGGVYAKELCLLSGIGQDDENIGEKQAKSLLDSIKSITKKKIEARIVYDKGKIKSVAPFELKAYENMKQEKAKSLSSAFEAVAKSEAPKKITKSGKNIAKLQKMISMQEEKILQLEKSADENAKKGELIYENYQLLKKILDEISSARKGYGWKYIKEKLKGHKMIKEVNEKTGEIVVEI
jgi:predicted ribosome quality control (RQC) complex YloA/Tae2 family protein